MAEPLRITWLPQFDATRDYVVQTPMTVKGQELRRGQPFDKSSVDQRQLRLFYETRRIAMMVTSDETAAFNRDRRQEHRGHRHTGLTVSVPKAPGDGNKTGDTDDGREDVTITGPVTAPGEETESTEQKTAPPVYDIEMERKGRWYVTKDGKRVAGPFSKAGAGEKRDGLAAA